MKDNIDIWWERIDMKDKFVIKIFSSLYGNYRQRIEQLYIIRWNLNLKSL